MKKINYLFLGINCLLFLNSSCVKPSEEVEMLNRGAETRRAFVLRNVSMVEEIERFMLANQAFIVDNRENIVHQYQANLYAFLSVVKSDDANFNRVIAQLKRNDRLNRDYYSKNNKVASEELISEIRHSDDTYSKMVLGESGDRKTCMALCQQNLSDCRESFYRDATFAVLAAGVGGFVAGLLPAINAGWGLLECQNRAQRNFDYCMGNS